jgi:hypothetical protein
MSSAKIVLSAKEQELVKNTDWILTKNAIIEKVYQLFGGLSETYRTELSAYPGLLADTEGFPSAKIAKGEQYIGLPWVMLDYPRGFGIKGHFAIRTFFWWGKFCSITLQLSGEPMQQYLPALQHYFVQTQNNTGWFLGTGHDPWQHHFEKNNYLPPEDWDSKKLENLSFVKLAKRKPLDNWADLPGFFEESYREILDMLTE